MRIHALSTGRVRVKQSFLHPRSGVRRQLDLFLPSPWSEPLPIHVWVVEHDGQRILVDTGEGSDVRDVPFARFTLRADEELPGALAKIGLGVGDLDLAVLTHLHGDHMDGAAHLPAGVPLLVHEREIAHAHEPMSRFFARVLRQPLTTAALTPMTLDAGSFGAFAASRRLTDDGRVRVVATPGHTPGHVSVLCIDDEDRHVLLAGDATDTLEQLRSRRPDAIGPKPAVTVETIDRILEHARQHPVVYLPSHDPESAVRLEASTTLAARRR